MFMLLSAMQAISLGILCLGVKANSLSILSVFKDGLLVVKNYFKKG